MFRYIRKVLADTLGVETYLKLVSSSYIQMVNAGLLKKKYPELFYLNHVIKAGDHCIDLGANVGYYATRLSKICGPQGKVYAVEPVNLFRQVLETNLRKFNCLNTEVIPFALGSENKVITMGTPEIAGVFRHGLTKIIEKEEEKFAQTYEVNMRIPDELFSKLTRLDFIKCDVEGYEVHIFPDFIKTIERFNPLVQIEISSRENRNYMFKLFSNLGYEIFKLDKTELVKLDEKEAVHYDQGDFYFKKAN